MRRPGSGSKRLEGRRVLLFALAAVLLHALVVPLLGERMNLLGRAPAGKVAPVRVVTLSPATRAALEQSRKTLAQHRTIVPVPPARPPEKPVQKIDGQIVDLPPSADDRAPDHARYLSEHNTRVDKETRSRYQSQHYKNAMNEPTTTKRGNVQGPLPPQKAQAIEVGPKTASKDSRAGQKQAQALQVPSSPQRDRLALRLDPHGAPIANHDSSEKLDGNSERLKVAPGEQGATQSAPGAAPKQGPSVLELVPQMGVLARLQGAPANDHLEDVDEGDGTFLNSREFKYASFFNRMKREVSENWRPMDEYRRRDPTGNIYGSRPRLTVLSITLNADGRVKDIQVSRSSGLDFLDHEAVVAFERAQPFPNPPKGLVGPAGDVTFPFGFHVDFGSGRGF